jgi:WD40 repeat protein
MRTCVSIFAIILCIAIGACGNRKDEQDKILKQDKGKIPPEKDHKTGTSKQEKQDKKAQTVIVVKKNPQTEAQLAAERQKQRQALLSIEKKILGELAKLPGIRSDNGEIGYLPNAVSPLAFSPDGNLLAYSGWDEKLARLIRIWDLVAGKKLHEFQADNSLIFELTFTSDGTTIVSHGSGYAIKRWDVKSGKLKKTIPLKDGTFAAFSPDGKLVAVLADQAVRILDTETGAEKRTLAIKQNFGMNKVAFSPSNNLIAVSHKNSVWVGETISGKKVFEIDFGSTVDRITFSPDGWSVAVAVSDKGPEKSRLLLWDLETNKKMPLTETISYPQPVTFSPDGRFLAYCYRDNLKIRELATEKEVQFSFDVAGATGTPVFSPGGNLLAVSSTVIYFWPFPDLFEKRAKK